MPLIHIRHHSLCIFLQCFVLDNYQPDMFVSAGPSQTSSVSAVVSRVRVQLFALNCAAVTSCTCVLLFSSSLSTIVIYILFSLTLFLISFTSLYWPFFLFSTHLLLQLSSVFVSSPLFFLVSFQHSFILHLPLPLILVSAFFLSLSLILFS